MGHSVVLRYCYESGRPVNVVRINISYCYCCSCCVQAIFEAERQMNYTLLRIMKSIKEAQQAAHNRLTKQQLVAVLQGITGFASAIFTSKVSEDPVGPFDYIDTALDIVDYDINKPCLVALDSVISSAKKWLTFGQYRPLEDSSDLNFDLIDVSSVTDIMQVWLIFFIYLFTISIIIIIIIIIYLKECLLSRSLLFMACPNYLRASTTSQEQVLLFLFVSLSGCLSAFHSEMARALP